MSEPSKRKARRASDDKIGAALRCSGEHANTLAMSRTSRLALLLAAVSIAAQGAWAEDSQTLEEMRVLRALVEKQSKQIETLTEQLAKLRIALEKAGDVPLGNAPPKAAPEPAVPVAPAPTVEFSPEAPKAEAADGKRHVVIKGETLTSIAKQYNLPVPELKKANKNVDERKLQIGQTLIIPTPKGAEAPTTEEKKP
jgi:hypothetical protein